MEAAWFEKVLALAGLFIFFGFLQNFTGKGGADRTSGSALFQVITLSFYLSAILMLLVRGIPRWTFRILLYSWPLVMLTFLPLASTLWSQAPEATFRRAVALLLSSTFSVFLIVRFDLRTVFNLLVVAFLTYAVIGLIAAQVPGLGIHPTGPYAGAWRGLSNKNEFGRVMALAVALLPVGALLRVADRRKLVLVTSAVAAVLLLLSRSATSLLSALASISIGGTLYFGLGGPIGRIRLRPELGLALLLVTFVGGAFALLFAWPYVLEATGRDPTLTGRTTLWAWTLHINEARQWLGSGYRAFWIDENTKYFFEFFWWGADAEGNPSDTFSGPNHAHNGYLDIYLEFGTVGISMFALFIVSALVTLQKTLSRGHVEPGLLFSIMLIFLLVYSAAEGAILHQSDDLWFLFVLFYLFLVKAYLLNNKSPEHVAAASGFKWRKPQKRILGSSRNGNFTS